MKTSYLIVGSITLLLTACTPAGVTTDTNVRLGGGLSDCTYHEVSNGTGSTIYVIRCPNSDISSRWQDGKVSRSVATLEDTK
jgi:hypothetical protein